MLHINIRIKGKVQGVGFRFSAMQAAYKFGITGFAMNVGQDMVYIEAEGTTDQLEKYLAWCHKGPPGARVDQVEKTEAPSRDFSSFEILARNAVI